MASAVRCIEVKRRISILAGVMAVLVAGCGGDTRQPDPPSGTAAARVAPLTPGDIDRQREGSAERTVLELWFWAQWGSVPSVVALYDPEVLEEVGYELVAGGYAFRRSALLDSRPRIAYTQRTDGGTVVGVDPGAGKAQESFLLHRVNGDWKVVFDTVLERGLDEYIRSVGRMVDGRPSPGTVADARRAASSYRVAFFCAGRETCRIPAEESAP